MKQLPYLGLLLLCLPFCVRAQITDPKATEVWEPEPRIVTPGETNSAPPSDAIILFDGSDLDAWQHGDGSVVKWIVEDGIATVKPRTGAIKTKEQFGDCQLHLEWRAPSVIEGEGQGRGNSGVFLQERYEVQVLDSYNNRTYSNGQAGSIYKQSMPLVNAMRAPGEWQTYDIIYQAPRFNEDGIKVSAATVTVIHNGVLIQNNTEIKGTTEYIGLPKNIAHGDGSIILQDHSNPVSYRNIWVRRL
jgi:hypothetical protein